jgi:stearoyl-CoA desaturase (delta-9 desaturase)
MKNIFTWSHVPLYFLLLIVLPTVGTALALYLLVFEGMIAWSDILIFAVMYVITELGVTVGYHRMLVHQSFQTSGVVKFIFLMLGSMTMQGPAITWASNHLKHHAFTDDNEDPHSPTIKGWLHAHFGWIFSITSDEVEGARQVFGKKFLRDKLVVFMNKTFFLWVVLGFVICYLVGGWTGLLWGGFVRLFFTLHVTWSVNSICHMFGSRLFNTADESRNNFWIGLLAMGEGWHNNHHAFPRSAFHGMRWWQIDFSGYLIRVMERLHVVWNVYRVPRNVLVEKAVK